MPQSTRPLPTAKKCAPAAGFVALLAVVLATANVKDAQAQSPIGAGPTRLPTTGHAGGFTEFAYHRQADHFAQQAPPPNWHAPPHQPYQHAMRLAEFQEEVAPGAAVFVDPQGLGGVDVMPLDFGDGECSTCGCGCTPCTADTRVGRFFCGLYNTICCPDPCYDPHWLALADSAFFTEAARPVTQSRLRWDAGINMVLPDRAEYFWARSGGGGMGPGAIETSLDYDELTYYTEAAHGNFSAFTEIPYRSLDADVNGHAAGFGDIVAGTKSMLLDSELIQLTLQMKFITPVGVAPKGLGAGHLSIEPSLLMALKLSPISYMQGQIAEWIPIAGDPSYSGALLHYHFSYNRTLAGAPQGVHWIGVAEVNGWSFQDGAYSDPVLGVLQPASNATYLSGGLGLRMVVCEKLDFGIGSAFALTSDHWAEQLFRSELRVRF